ncbi:MAG: flippase-like domain-containing protein [Actinomycetota bacterium]|nr:flippase-like domain-containing protein [Actinomycetota bacterium]
MQATEPATSVAVPQRGLRDWVRLGLLVLAMAFGAYFVASRWGRLSSILGRMDPRAVIASVILAAAGTLLGMMGWRAMLADLGARLPVSMATRVFLVGQLGKYLPGSVWSFLGQAELAKAQRVSRKAALTGSLLGAGVMIAAGLTLAAALLPFGSTRAVHTYWWVVLVVPVFVLALHPRISGAVVDRGLRLIRRQPLDSRPTYAGMLRAAAWYAVGWVLLGLHAWLLAVALGAPAVASLAVAIGGFALAVCIGLLFLPAPAGAGVREIALTVTLSPVLGPTEALAVALVSRVILAVLDFVLAGLAALWVRRLRHRLS